MIFFQLNKWEFINQTPKFMTCLFKNISIEKNEVAFLSANTWDVSGGGNYGYQFHLGKQK